MELQRVPSACCFAFSPTFKFPKPHRAYRPLRWGTCRHSLNINGSNKVPPSGEKVLCGFSNSLHNWTGPKRHQVRVSCDSSGCVAYLCLPGNFQERWTDQQDGIAVRGMEGQALMRSVLVGGEPAGRTRSAEEASPCRRGCRRTGSLHGPAQQGLSSTSHRRQRGTFDHMCDM